MSDQILNEVLNRLVSLESYIKERDKNNDEKLDDMKKTLKENTAQYWALHGRLVVLETRSAEIDKQAEKTEQRSAVKGLGAGGLVVGIEKLIEWIVS